MPPKNLTLLSEKLQKELHPTLNGGIDLSKLGGMSSQLLWWQCELGHTWETPASYRTKGSGCPTCSGRIILPGFNDMATLYPELAAQFHPTKNLPDTPQTLGRSNSQKFVWLCDKGHEFLSSLNNRVSSKASGCPVCSGKQILPGFNDLATLNPELAPYWNTEKNGDLTPQQVGKSYSKKVWWKCDKGHEYETLISNRRLYTSCNICSGKQVLTGFNDLATTNPEIIKYWHPTKNLPYTPETVTHGFTKKMWWTCENNHEYESLTTNRLKVGDICSFCAGNKLITGVNDLATKKPELTSQWSKLNTVQPTEVAYSSNQKVWWECAEGHSWEASVSNRSKGTGCPVCAGHRIDLGVNDLATLYPELAAEWHPTKNGSITPEQVTAGLSRSFWWKCEKGHEYSAHIRDRVLGDGCNKCYRLGLPSGAISLAQAYPDIAKQWDHSKNTIFTPETVVQTSSKRVWWKCETNPAHSWITPVASRTSGNSDCPVCWKTNQTSKAEQEIGEFLKSLNKNIIVGDRKILDGQEIDFYLPEKKIGVEYNGLYWHSELAGKDSKYHQNKLLKAQSKGITLIQVWEDDWLERKDIIKRHLAYRLNKFKALQAVEPTMNVKFFETTFARKTTVTISTFQEVKAFLNENHIQGEVKGTHYLALKDDNNNLKAVLVLARNGQADTYLISRYATCGLVQGGFTKLLKAAIKLYAPKKLVTFADLTISSGDLYEKTGFQVEEIIKPDYSYIKNKKKYHKFGFRLKRFKSDPNLIFKEGLTEKELAELNGYSRIWDAGKIRYALDL